MDFNSEQLDHMAKLVTKAENGDADEDDIALLRAVCKGAAERSPLPAFIRLARFVYRLGVEEQENIRRRN